MGENKAKRVMSGMRTTHQLHIGNYFGALKNWIKLQDEYQCFFGAMDWHALTDAYKKTKEISPYVKDIISDYIAWGLDYEKNVIFVQSMVPEHLELFTVFSNITPMGWLERVPTWKDAEEELKAKDAYNLGRFAYPVLQTADISIYQGELVPVGQDQVPHLELSREIVRRFNHLYGPTLPEPKPLLTEVPLVSGTDGRKMSKSYGNVVPLTEDEKLLKKRVNKMVTDPQRIRREDPGEPTKCPTYAIHTLFTPESQRQEVVEPGCRTAGIGCGDCKLILFNNMNEKMKGPREKKKELLNNSKLLDSIIAEGCQRARNEAQKTLAKVKKAMTFGMLK